MLLPLMKSVKHRLMKSCKERKLSRMFLYYRRVYFMVLLCNLLQGWMKVGMKNLRCRMRACMQKLQSLTTTLWAPLPFEKM